MIKDALIVMPFILPWDWSADYQKQTCLALAKNNQIIVYLQKNAQFFLKKIFNKPRPKYPQIKNIHFYAPTYYIPGKRFKFIDKLNQIIAFKFFVWKFKLRKFVLWIFDPMFYFYSEIVNCQTIYDCVDYHWHANKDSESKIRINEKRLIETVDKFIVNSKILARLHSRLRKPHLIAPQGFRIQDFQNPQPSKVIFPKTKPIIGLVGALDYRLDFELLFKLIKNNPQWRFVLWGPVQKDPQDFSVNTAKNIRKLFEFPNVTKGLSKNRKEIPAIIKQFDIAIIPYDISQLFSRYCYPMKLFEYFYMGKPVVSTPIEELKRFPKFVKIGNSPKQWEQHIKKLLAKPWPKSYKKIQRRLAEKNSWQKKIEAISQLFETHSKK